MKIAIIGSRGYPYVYSGYETFVKELVERLVTKKIKVTVYCHKNLLKKYPKKVNGVSLIYISTIEKKTVSQFIHSFQSIVHACLHNYDIILIVNSANGPFGLITKLFRKKTAINVDGLEWLRPKWRGLGSKYFYVASKLSTILYDGIITDSFEMAKVYKKEFNSESTVIAYGANIPEVYNKSLIKKWQLETNNYYFQNDVTAHANISDDLYMGSLVFGDIDNDGDLDLYISRLRKNYGASSFLPAPNRLYRNDSNGSNIIFFAVGLTVLIEGGFLPKISDGLLPSLSTS